jgi:hypothetical protein
MLKKLTITVDSAVYDRLHRVIGRRRISRFLNDIARAHAHAHVICQDLSTGRAAMAEDSDRGIEAEAWSEGLVTDIADAAGRLG